jgi:hypothetical protein
MMLICVGEKNDASGRYSLTRQRRLFAGDSVTYLVDVLGTVVQAPPNSAGASNETKRITNL